MKVPEPATYITHHRERPQNGQLVWLLIMGEEGPMPAQYTAQQGDGKPRYLKGEHYSLLRGREHYPRHGDSWAPLDPPENANQCSPAPGECGEEDESA